MRLQPGRGWRCRVFITAASLSVEVHPYHKDRLVVRSPAATSSHQGSLVGPLFWVDGGGRRSPSNVSTSASKGAHFRFYRAPGAMPGVPSFGVVCALKSKNGRNVSVGPYDALALPGATALDGHLWQLKSVYSLLIACLSNWS